MGYEYEVYVWNGHEYTLYWQGETWTETVTMMNLAAAEGYGCVKFKWRPRETTSTLNARPADGVVEALIKVCELMRQAMRDYEMDVECDPTPQHIDMMKLVEDAIQKGKAAVGGEHE